MSELLAEIADVGTDPRSGGYRRPVFGAAETMLREWFAEQAGRRGLEVETDDNGIIWAWWNPSGGPLRDAVVTGSHLDSVPGGGAYDGPLGVASALAALERLQRAGHRPDRPMGIAVFPEEEGSRFGVACLGSRLLTGSLDPVRAAALRDDEGLSFGEVAAQHGLRPERLGRDAERLARIGTFVELHVEQGRGLVDLDRPVAIGTSILGHGRWRLQLTGQGNHAGTTAMDDRRDPMVAAGAVIGAVRELARARPSARATVGRLVPTPGGTNVIASRVDLWLDVRDPDDRVWAELVEQIRGAADRIATDEGCSAELTEESASDAVAFDSGVRARLRTALPDAPELATGAGHDAGVLASVVPTGMIFVRNPTGISHAPQEHVTDADAELGVQALADVLRTLLSDSSAKEVSA